MKIQNSTSFVWKLLLSALSFAPAPVSVAGSDVPIQSRAVQNYTDQLIVKLRDGQIIAAANLIDNRVVGLSSRAGTSLTHFRVMSNGAQVFKLPRSMHISEVEAIARRLGTDAQVEYAEPDLIMYPLVTPSDASYSSQWHYHESSTEVGGLNLPAAWDITQGSASIVVGVLDTGLLPHGDIDSNILDTSGRVIPGFDFISDVDTANDTDGRDANPTDPGDWVTLTESTTAGGVFRGCPVSSSSWHGTHVAGTIGARSNDGSGNVAGVDWNARILPLRVLGKCGGTSSDIADALRWAVGISTSGISPTINPNPAKVLNLSFGSALPASCGVTLQDAINDITVPPYNAVVVVAAGNEAADAASYAPANCNGVIVVAATDRFGGRASYSNFGASIDVAAPGGDDDNNDRNVGPGEGVLSTWNSGTTTPLADAYAYAAGTSQATPHVSGVVSLMQAARVGAGLPLLTPPQLLQKLQQSARPFPTTSCTTSTCGAGIVNAYAAVRCSLVGLAPNAFAGSSQSVNPGSIVTLVGTATDDCAASYLWTPPVGITLSSATVARPTFTAPSVAGGTVYTFSLTVADDESPANFSAPATVNVTINDVAPVLTPIGNKIVYLGHTSSFTVMASDGNGTPTVLSATGLPTGATFVPATGIFTWPNAGPLGTYVLTFTATSAGMSDSETITINVQTMPGSRLVSRDCFIATAAYGTPMAEQVRFLRAFRDEYLQTNRAGRWFVTQYYEFSPPFANYLWQHSDLRALVRTALSPLVLLSKKLVSAETLAMQQ